MNKGIVVYFVAESGFMPSELSELFLSNFEKNGYVVEDIGAGSAYNMPIYLLGEVERNIDKAVIVSVRFEDGRPVPMVFFDEDEVDAVIEHLKKAGKDEDTFDILVEVHKKIRG